MTKHIVSFSGGKDSTAMLLMMVEYSISIDGIVFCDTEKEFPQMYDHIEKVQKYIGQEITILREPGKFDYLMFDHVKNRGKNRGKKVMDGRICELDGVLLKLRMTFSSDM